MVYAGHLRALAAPQPFDVASSDRHVVKPWFNGRIDFAPPVVELAPQGFPLVGGRLDYLDGRPVAALVYRRRLHSINLFVRPAPALASPVAATTRRDGYSLVRWVAGGLEYWAVSDVDTGDLQAFRTAFRKASGT
jgi:anti-sigma factor RsiW